jgi:hypothetical protein
MPIFLDEDMISGDPAEVCYPHLLLCMGVTVKMSDGYLIGAHVSEPTTEALVLAELVQQINAYIALHHGVTMDKLYCTGDFAEHVTHHGGGDVAAKAQALGFHGDAYSFDASPIKPKHGTFVTVRSNGPAHPCGIFYKRDEKVKYDNQYGPAVSQISTYKLNVRQVPSANTGFRKPIHKLHDATHLLQIQHHVIP